MLYDGGEPIERVRAAEGHRRRLLAPRPRPSCSRRPFERRLLIAPVTTHRRVVRQRPARGPRLLGRRRRRPSSADRPVRRPVPGASQLSATPLAAARRPPRLGEHTAAVLAEAAGRRPATAAGRPPPAPSPPRGRRARRSRASRCSTSCGRWPARPPPGCWPTTAPPWCGSSREHHLDAARTVGPFLDDRPASRRRACSSATSTPASSASPSTWRSPRPARWSLDLVRWADVVVESFSPRAMARLGPRLRVAAASSTPTWSCCRAA